MDLVAAPGSCRVIVHPAKTAVPVQSENSDLLEVPASITDQSALWVWLKDLYPEVAYIYKPATGEWFKVHQVVTAPLPPSITLHFCLRRAPAGPVSSTLGSICKNAKERGAHLIASYAAHGRYNLLRMEQLSDPSKQSSIVFMERGEDDDATVILGRRCIASVTEFIRESTVRWSKFNFVLGSAGSGKTYSVRAASLYLFLEFHSSAQGRLMHVNGEEFSSYPAMTLIRSLALAYHDSHAAEYYIQTLKNDKDVEQVIKIMRKIIRGENKRKLYVVLDDGPELSAENAVQLRSIATFAVVILCGKWQLFGDGERSYFINGGFDEAEILNYLALVKAEDTTTKESILWKTGWVPGLVAGSSKKYRKILKEYIRNLPSDDWPRFSKLISEGTFEYDEDDVFPEQATGLFYRCEDRVLCLSERLLSYAANQFMLLTNQTDMEQIDASIQLWTSVILRDPGMYSRIGLNTEQACILVARYKQPVINYGEGSVTIDPTVVRSFRGSFSISKGVSVPTFYVPQHGTEKGLDCYYVTDSHVVVLQFAVGIEDDVHARPRAEEIFMRDDKSRTHVLAWVVYCLAPWVESRKVDAADGSEVNYHEVYLNFGCFDKSLACIDAKLHNLRGGRYSGEANPRCCVCGEQQTGEDDIWNQCANCQCWYHQACDGVNRRCLNAAQKEAKTAKALWKQAAEKAAAAAMAKDADAQARSSRAKKRKKDS